MNNCSFVLLAALLTASLSGCKQEEQQAAPLAAETKRREKTRVRTTPVVEREMVRTLSTTTVVESEKEISIFPRVAGVVVELHAEEGDRVGEGQVLAVLDQRDAKAAIADARVALREAEENIPKMRLAREEADEQLARMALLHEKAERDFNRNENAGLISQQELDQLRLTRDTARLDEVTAKLALERAVQDERAAETAVERAKLALGREELNLSYTEITAPFAGVIASRAIKFGDSVSSAAAAFVLTDPYDLRAVFFRPQRELPLFRGSSDDADAIEIKVTAEAIPDKTFTGRIELVSPTIDSASGSVRLTVDLDQPEDAPAGARLLPGMLIRLAIVTDRHPNAHIVPKRALTREGDTSFIFVVDDGIAHRIQVVEGFSDDQFVEVMAVDGELEIGREVVVVGNRDLEEGSEVEIERETPLPADEPVAQSESANDTAVESTGSVDAE